MRHPADRKTRIELLPLSPVPELPDSATTDELLALMHDTATHYWRCHAAYGALCDLSAEERAELPEFRDLMQAARLGMAAARATQERAAARLELLRAMPENWRRWPERRSVPRGPAFG